MPVWGDSALRKDLRQLQELRCDLKDSAGLRDELAELKKDLTATKRLMRQCGSATSSRLSVECAAAPLCFHLVWV